MRDIGCWDWGERGRGDKGRPRTYFFNQLIDSSNKKYLLIRKAVVLIFLHG